MATGNQSTVGMQAGEAPERRILAERLAHLRRQMPLVLGANMAVVPFVAIVLSDSLTPSGATAWASALLVLSLVRWLIMRAVATGPGSPAGHLEREAHAFTIGSMASGILWGLMGGATILANRGLDPLLALMFICGMVSGAIGSLSTLPRVYAAFAVPAVLPVIVLYMLRQDMGDITYAFAAIIYLAVNLGYAVSFSRTLASSIALRFENADLIVRLEEARGRAEAESSQKTRFLQSASHDLRQPLHAVTLTLADLAEQLPDKLRPKLNQGLASVQSLAELLDRLLEASLAGSGQMVSASGPTELAEIFASLEFETASEAAARGLAIQFRPSDHWAHTDALILTQILRNYLSNALRHARSRILVCVRPRGGSLRVEVWDDGPGIAADQHEAIYEAFYQIGNQQRDPARGRGLGLSIVAGMARVLEAEHGLCSRPGSGSVFHIRLPATARPERIDDRTDIPEPQEAPDPKRDRIQADGRQAIRVLVIEDDENLRTVTCELISRWGAETTAAGDGETALELVAAGYRPNAVVSDHRLPGALNGAEAIDRIRRQVGSPVPALIITGAADAVPEAARLDIALMKKPMLPGRLKAWLQTVRP